MIDITVREMFFSVVCFSGIILILVGAIFSPIILGDVIRVLKK